MQTSPLGRQTPGSSSLMLKKLPGRNLESISWVSFSQWWRHHELSSTMPIEGKRQVSQQVEEKTAEVQVEPPLW